MPPKKKPNRITNGSFIKPKGQPDTSIQTTESVDSSIQDSSEIHNLEQESGHLLDSPSSKASTVESGRTDSVDNLNLNLNNHSTDSLPTEPGAEIPRAPLGKLHPRISGQNTNKSATNLDFELSDSDSRVDSIDWTVNQIEKKFGDFSRLPEGANKQKTQQELIGFINTNKASLKGQEIPTLIEAYKKNEDLIVGALMDAEVNLDVKDSEGFTTLMYACHYKQMPFAKILIENGANPKIQNEDLNTAYDITSIDLKQEFKGFLKTKNYTYLRELKNENQIVYDLYTGYIENINSPQSLSDLLKKINGPNFKPNNAFVIADSNVKTLLLEVCNNGHLEVAQALLEQKANTNFQDENGDTALILACRNERMDIAQALVEVGTDWSIKNKEGKTAYHNCHPDLQESLKEIFQQNLNSRSEVLNSVADQGVDKKNEPYVELLKSLLTKLNHEMISIKSQNQDGISRSNSFDSNQVGIAVYPYYKTIPELYEDYKRDSSTENLKKLLEAIKNPKIDLDNIDIDRIPFLIAAYGNGHVEVVEALINGGADLNIKNEYGDTALILACTNGHNDIVQALINGRADLNIKDEYGDTALILACTNGHNDIVQALINGRADLNIKDKYGYTSLILACREGKADIAQALIKGGADLNIKDEYGYTSLILACREGKADIAQALINGGADWSIKNQHDETTYDYCDEVFKVKLAKILNQNLIDRKGNPDRFANNDQILPNLEAEMERILLELSQTSQQNHEDASSIASQDTSPSNSTVVHDAELLTSNLVLIKSKEHPRFQSSIWNKEHKHNKSPIISGRNNDFKVEGVIYKKDTNSTGSDFEYTENQKAEIAMAIICNKIINRFDGKDFSEKEKNFQAFLLFAKENGGISNIYDEKQGKFRKTNPEDVKGDADKLKLWKEVSKEFQDECRACGIYSGRNEEGGQIKLKNDGKPVGLRITFLPQNSLVILGKIKRNEITPDEQFLENIKKDIAPSKTR